MLRKPAMSSRPHPSASPVPRRLGYVHALAFLWLLAALLGVWHQAQASAVGSEVVYFVSNAEFEAAQETAAGSGVEEGCRKPLPFQPTPTDLLCHEVDQAVPPHWQNDRTLRQAAPAPGPQHILPEAGQQPLLRPPAALG